MNSDKIAVALSTACVIHCFFAPSLIILSYSFLSLSIDSELIHYLILLFALPVSMFALISGYRNHKIISHLFVGFFGLAVLLSAVFLSDILFEELGEQVITLLGSMFVAYAHYKNYIACKQLQCNCHDSKQVNL